MYLSVFLVDESFVLATLMDDALGRRFGDLVAISGHQRRRLFVGLLQTFTRLTFPSQRRQTRWIGDGRFQFLPKNEKQKIKQQLEQVNKWPGSSHEIHCNTNDAINLLIFGLKWRPKKRRRSIAPAVTFRQWANSSVCVPWQTLQDRRCFFNHDKLAYGHCASTHITHSTRLLPPVRLLVTPLTRHLLDPKTRPLGRELGRRRVPSGQR